MNTTATIQSATALHEGAIVQPQGFIAQEGEYGVVERISYREGSMYQVWVQLSGMKNPMPFHPEKVRMI